MNWTAPQDNGGAAITGYVVRAFAGTATTAAVEVPAGADATSWDRVRVDQRHHLHVHGGGDQPRRTGPASAASNSVTPAGPPAAPTIGTVDRGNGSATVNWTAPQDNGGAAITGYVVRAFAGTATTAAVEVPAGADATTATVSGLTNGTGYMFTVAATNPAGTGPASAASNSVTPAGPPAAPTIGTASAGNGSATVRWAAPGDTGGAPITSFRVQVFAGAATTAVATVPAGAAARSVTVPGLTNGTRYAFRVSATNAAGTGPASAASHSVTPVGPTVSKRSPGVNATNVAVGSNVTVTFSEPVTGLPAAGRSTGAAPGNFVVRTPAGLVVPAAISYNSTGRVATLNPTANLAADTRYTVSLSAGIRDRAGNPLAATSWAFITGPAPTVSKRSPGVNATNVAVGSNVTVTFSEPVTGLPAAGRSTGAAPGNFVVRTPAGLVVPAAISYNSTGRVATLNPTANLAADTRYTVSLSAGIRDRAGNPLAATSWAFITGPAPTVSKRSPGVNATNVAVGSNVTVTFSEPVTGLPAAGRSTGAAPGNFVVRTPAGLVVPAAISYNSTGRVATLNPTANLAADTRYTVSLSAGIRDRAGNPLAATSWAFITGPAPTVSKRSPGVNATNVAVGSNVTVTFSEPVTGLPAAGRSTGAAPGNFVVRTPAGLVVPAAISYNSTGRVATLNPTANLAADTRYTVSLSAGIRDRAGNPLAATSWAFITGPAPTVSKRSPGVNATNVAVGSNVTVTFSEPVTGLPAAGRSTGAAPGNFVVRTPAGLVVPAAISYNSTGRVATLNPTANLAADTRYTVSLSAGIRDRAGNPLAATSWACTTRR